jgi:hypothetical protein
MTETILQGDGDRLPKRNLVDTVNDRLRVNNTEEDQLTLQDLAQKLKIDTKDLYQWAEGDQELKDGLEWYKSMQDTDMFSDENFGNRADAMVLAMLLLETKKRHGK